MAKMEKLIETLSGLTLLEAAELVKALKEAWNISDMPMMAAMPAGAASQPEAVQEKTHFDVVLVSLNDPTQKTSAIKLVREFTELSLQDSKKLVEEAPKLILGAVEKAKADEIKAKFEALNAKVELQ